MSAAEAAIWDELAAADLAYRVAAEDARDALLDASLGDCLPTLHPDPIDNGEVPS